VALKFGMDASLVTHEGNRRENRRLKKMYVRDAFKARSSRSLTKNGSAISKAAGR
jgi:hypothetical protein